MSSLILQICKCIGKNIEIQKKKKKKQSRGYSTFILVYEGLKTGGQQK